MNCRGIWMAGLLGSSAVVLAACGTDSSTSNGIIMVEDESTAAPVTDAVRAATRTPVPTGEPFVLPTLDSTLDPDLPITRVGHTTITLSDYQKTVRFERFARLYSLALTVEKRGPEVVLDLTNPANQVVESLFATLAESYSFGEQVHRIMIIDALTLQEATRRGIDIDTLQFDARRVQYLNQQVGEGGQLPATFDADYARFLNALTRYTGMNEEDFLRIVRARVLYSQLKAEISQSPEANPPAGMATVGKKVEDMIIDTYDEAVTVTERLKAGEALADIMTSRGYTASSAETSRVVRYSDDDLSDAMQMALAGAADNAVIGPLPVTNGWYVARVLEDVNDTLSPADIDAYREDYFLNWIESLMDDPTLVEDFDNWVDYTPQEPLPQDVSPLLRDEYVKVPERATPTATPGSGS